MVEEKGYLGQVGKARRMEWSDNISIGVRQAVKPLTAYLVILPVYDNSSYEERRVWLTTQARNWMNLNLNHDNHGIDIIPTSMATCPLTDCIRIVTNNVNKRNNLTKAPKEFDELVGYFSKLVYIVKYFDPYFHFLQSIGRASHSDPLITEMYM